MRIRRRRRRWGPTVLVLLAGLLLGLALQVDVDAYRGRAVDAVSAWIDQPVTLGGRLRVRLLGGPALVLADVEVGDRVLSAREVRIGLRFWPLLIGRLEPTTVTLTEPRLRSQGLVVWRSSGDGGWPSLPLERLEVVDGVVEAGGGTVVDGVAMTIVPAAANGPFEVKASARRGGDALRLEATVGRLEAGRPAGVVVKLHGSGIEAALTAAINRGAQGLEVGGPVMISAADAAATLARLGIVATPTSGPATVEAKLAWADGRLRLSDLTFTAAGIDAVGEVDLAESLRAGKVQLAFRRLEVEPWLGTLASLLDGAAGRDLSLVLTADAAVLRTGLVRQIRADLRLLDGQMALRQLTALLPGGTEVTAFGRASSTGPQPVYEGEIDVVSDNLRVALAWLGLEPRGIAPDRLRRAAFSARLSLTGDRLAVPSFDVKLDTSRMFGGGTLVLGPSPRVELRVAVDRLTIDPYQPLFAAAADLGLSGTVTASADLATWHGLSLRDLDLDLVLDRASVDLRRLRIGEVAGARVAATGRIDLAASGADLSFEFTTARLAELLRLLGKADAGGSGTSGTLAAAGRMQGALSALALSGAVVTPSTTTLLDGTVRLAGPGSPALEPGPGLAGMIERLAGGGR